uniref:Uncharacterized protein n=1 Tax=Chrysotila carterae TaxID=13221 RepID=A0A7S4BZR5_CHRCT|mmetsp:Transcript_53704/g.117146  ORF Transcript_53704/g.117146 Transcript_53704/m.117146 type:complete len:223 (-) Transcript_53704:188-856(-)
MCRQPSETVHPPTLLPRFQIEYSVHRPSRLLRKDVEIVFRPDLQTEYERHPDGAATGVEKDQFLRVHLLAIPTWQPATLDLSEMSFEVNEQRKKLLVNFDMWAVAVRKRLEPFWSDAACPVEGNAHFGTSTSSIYNELEGLTQLLKYSSVPIGCCGIVLHPTWQRRAYPVTFFTTAPSKMVLDAIAQVEAEHSGLPLPPVLAAAQTNDAHTAEAIEKAEETA